MKARKAEGERFCFFVSCFCSSIGVQGGVRTSALDILNLRYLLDGNVRWKSQKNSWI